MKNGKTRNIVLTAMMIALMLVLQVTGIGLIKLGVVNVTFYCTVIAIGTLVLGWKSGVTLGAAFTAISFWSALQAPSGLVAPLMAQSVPLVFVMCFLPRMLVPLTTHFLNGMLAKLGVNEKLSLALSAACGSLCNTILYLGIMLIGYAVTVADYPGVLATVGTIALTAGLPEAAAAAIVSTPVVLALRKVYK